MTTDKTNELPPSPGGDPGAGDVSPAQLVRAMLATQQSLTVMTQFLAEAHASHRPMTQREALDPAHSFIEAYTALAQIWARFTEQVSAESARVGAMYGRSLTSDVSDRSEGDPDGAEQRVLAEAAATLLEHWALAQQVAACLEDVQARSQALLATYGQDRGHNRQQDGGEV